MEFKELMERVNKANASIEAFVYGDINIYYGSNKYTISGYEKNKLYVMQDHYCDGNSYDLLQACVEYASTDLEDRKLTENDFTFKYHLKGGYWSINYYVQYDADYRLMNLVCSADDATEFEAGEFEEIAKHLGMPLKNFTRKSFIKL